MHDKWKAKLLSRPLPFLLSLGFCLLPAGAQPFLEMKFHLNSSTSLTNTGTAGTSATLSAPNPTFQPNTPFGGGAHAVDIASAAGTSAVDLLTGEVLNAAKDLKSFSILGWVNCRSSTVSAGGNRIVSWYQPQNNGDGVDLAMNSSGALSLGIKSWNDWGGVTSNAGKVTVDAATSYNNWRFFAVVYDGTATSGQVKFYFGTSTSPAELDRTVTYNKGLTGVNIAPSVTLGNHSTASRSASNHAAFRGLMDEIRIYGSKTNGAGALSHSMIQTLQGAAPLAGQPGLLYERWNNITGTTISSLTSNSRFPNTPDQTLVRTTFEGFVNAGDNYGIKMSGWIEAPVTGSYVFGLTSDDAGELRLSSNANPVNKQLILNNPTWSSINTWAQQSAPIPLEAGQYYYIEVLMKEGTGGEHVKVGWKRPSDTEIQVIGAPALFVTPPETDAMYPSAYHLYEPGTGTRKATMGWQKEPGNSHFYIEAEGHRSLKVQNGSVVVPDKLVFGGKFTIDPNQNDLGFRWDRPTVGDYGSLFLETQGGRWAYRVQSGSEMEPHTEFNRFLDVTGPDVTDGTSTWRTFGSMHYMDGLLFDRQRVGMPAGQSYREHTNQDANKLTLQRDLTVDGETSSSYTHVYGGEIELQGKDLANRDAKLWLDGRGLRYEASDGEGGTMVTLIHGGGVTAPVVRAENYVSTLKWKVVPDYVFEKGYKLRSLEETERFVKEKKHLPEIPSAKEMSSKGMNLTDMNLQLLKKVEELTLHMIALDKELKVQKQNNIRLERKVGSLGAGREN